MSSSDDDILAELPQLAARIAMLKKAEQRFYTMFSHSGTAEDAGAIDGITASTFDESADRDD